MDNSFTNQSENSPVDSANFKTRHTDVVADSSSSHETILPKINWSLIGGQAPVKLPIGARQPDDPLPEADWVVITWTSAEWRALDHVFLSSDQESSSADFKWKDQWHQYSRGSHDYPADAKSGKLWGLFQLVQITDQSNRPWRVLLFKSNSHLAHSPWIAGLSAMMKCILTDTKAARVYTIGTAGGARLNQCLGDTVITNAATLELQRPQNIGDAGNGDAFRCPTWYPSTRLVEAVQSNLLLKLDSVVTSSVLDNLFEQLKAKHDNLSGLSLVDLLNDSINPIYLNAPKITSLKDAPLLTTDFYFIANGNSSDAFAFLEMDDAVIAREANAMGVQFACIRNISDPIVPSLSQSGAVISDSVRGDWSGLIYTNFGLYTSFNGALATWATICGEGSKAYNPERFVKSPDEADPLEIKLVYEVRSCGTCKFFWPDNKKDATYGPYTAFDFDVNVPYVAGRSPDAFSAPWALGRTRPPSFPDGEVLDGCRKSPIMTIGINPNLTAFAPGQNGAPWAYPNFSSDNGTNGWAKYAWYYRYRSVYQEKLSLDFVKKYILPEGQILAARNGKVTSATRIDENQSWSFTVRYDGFADDVKILLTGAQGDFPYMLFFDTFGPNNTFAAGDVLAAKVAVPEGIQVEIMQAKQGYYMQFVPTLQQFEDFLKAKGHAGANLEIGEDVSQIDMVACASPHWTEGYLGNQMSTIVDNCISKNAWVVKQFVQSRPAVLYIVSESSWNMFYEVFGNFVDSGKISAHPVDQSYTLLRETTDLDNPVYLKFDFTIDGIEYKSKTRIVITPHFSFNTNFVPQYRLSPEVFAEIAGLPDFSAAITVDNGFTVLAADPKHPTYYREIQLQPATGDASRAKLKESFPVLYNSLEPYYYDSHALMASVLMKMYDDGELSYDETKQYLTRTEGACKFCVNQHWQFPDGCRYNKPGEPALPSGYLEKVAAYIVENGRVEQKDDSTLKTD
jgi:nucleoside phosphorylase